VAKNRKRELAFVVFNYFARSTRLGVAEKRIVLSVEAFACIYHRAIIPCRWTL